MFTWSLTCSYSRCLVCSCSYCLWMKRFWNLWCCCFCYVLPRSEVDGLLSRCAVDLVPLVYHLEIDCLEVAQQMEFHLETCWVLQHLCCEVMLEGCGCEAMFVGCGCETQWVEVKLLDLWTQLSVCHVWCSLVAFWTPYPKHSTLSAAPPSPESRPPLSRGEFRPHFPRWLEHSPFRTLVLLHELVHAWQKNCQWHLYARYLSRASLRTESVAVHTCGHCNHKWG